MEEEKEENRDPLKFKYISPKKIFLRSPKRKQIGEIGYLYDSLGEQVFSIYPFMQEWVLEA